MKLRKLTQAMMVVVIALSPLTAMAAADTTVGSPSGAQAGAGYGYGAGMMGGRYGPGMMGAYGGYGPGMMGGYGAGTPGGYGGYGGGYGPGMMGGYGRGMMGGDGPGPGWGRGYGGPLALLNLSTDQREKIAQIQENARERNWATMGQLRSEEFKLRSLYNADKPSPEAVADQQKKVDELRRQLTKARVETNNEMQTVLTKEQREQLRANARWWAEDGNVED